MARFRTLIYLTILSMTSFLVIMVIQTDIETSEPGLDPPVERVDNRRGGDSSHVVIKQQIRSYNKTILDQTALEHPKVEYQSNVVKIKKDYSSLYHEYDGDVDLRIIVITFNRPESLSKTLMSLQDLVTDGYSVSLEIWIDMAINGTSVDPETLQVARDFRWSSGPTTVWVHTQHVGLFGQWLYTWRPRVDDMVELALFVEDDVDVSKYGYRWLRLLHDHYQSRDYVACYTLQDDNAIGSSGKYTNKEIPKPTTSPIFFHRLPGSWAMAPHPQKWRHFQDWYETRKLQKDFRPYVKAAKLQTSWYKTFEKQNRQDSMWTMWYIYYTSERKQLCAYANLPTYTGRNDTSLSSNRKESGLHYTREMVAGYVPPGLLNHWNHNYVTFPEPPPIYDFSGRPYQHKYNT